MVLIRITDNSVCMEGHATEAEDCARLSFLTATMLNYMETVLDEHPPYVYESGWLRLETSGIHGPARAVLDYYLFAVRSLAERLPDEFRLV